MFGFFVIVVDEFYYCGDLLINGGVILVFVFLVVLGWLEVDGFLGFVIVIYLIYVVWEIGC